MIVLILSGNWTSILDTYQHLPEKAVTCSLRQLQYSDIYVTTFILHKDLW